MTEPLLLRGLQPQPLATYLAALGLLRVYSEQADASVAGCWSPNGFALYGVSKDALLSFLVDRYRPTPLVAPWAGGSGFSEGEDTSAIDAIRSSTEPRLALYREVIERVRRFPELPPRGLRIVDVKAWASERIADPRTKEKQRTDLTRLLTQAGADETPEGTSVDRCKQGHPIAKIFTFLESERRVANKSALAARCRNELPDECLGWIDAEMILASDEAGAIAEVNGPLAKDAMKPRLEFSRLYMDAVGATIIGAPSSAQPIAAAMLFGELTAGLTRSAAGLFELASAGGFNMGPRFSEEDLPNNPWSILMMFEGSATWSGALSRRASPSRAPNMLKPEQFPVVTEPPIPIIHNYHWLLRISMAPETPQVLGMSWKST